MSDYICRNCGDRTTRVDGMIYHACGEPPFPAPSQPSEETVTLKCMMCDEPKRDHCGETWHVKLENECRAPIHDHAFSPVPDTPQTSTEPPPCYCCGAQSTDGPWFRNGVEACRTCDVCRPSDAPPCRIHTPQTEPDAKMMEAAATMRGIERVIGLPLYGPAPSRTPAPTFPQTEPVAEPTKCECGQPLDTFLFIDATDGCNHSQPNIITPSATRTPVETCDEEIVVSVRECGKPLPCAEHQVYPSRTPVEGPKHECIMADCTNAVTSEWEQCGQSDCGTMVKPEASATASAGKTFEEWWQRDKDAEFDPQRTINRKDAARLAWNARDEQAKRRPADYADFMEWRDRHLWPLTAQLCGASPDHRLRLILEEVAYRAWKAADDRMQVANAGLAERIAELERDLANAKVARDKAIDSWEEQSRIVRSGREQLHDERTKRVERDQQLKQIAEIVRLIPHDGGFVSAQVERIRELAKGVGK